MTMADLSLYSFICFLSGSNSQEDAEPDGDAAPTGEVESFKYLHGLPDSLFDDYPALIDHRRRVEELPAVASFHSKVQHHFGSYSFRPTELD